MVVLGQWPYQHTITLDQLRHQAGAAAYYFVDEDKIVSRTQALKLESSGYILNDTYLTVMSENMNTYVSAFSNQIFPPSPHSSVIPHLKSNANPEFIDNMNKIQNSAAVLVVNEQSKEVMEDIGGQWNSSLGVWVIDGTALRLLREKRRQKTDGRISIMQNKGGVYVEVWGDVTPHVQLLKDVGGRYDEEKDIWNVPMSSVHKIMHIVS